MGHRGQVTHNIYDENGNLNNWWAKIFIGALLFIFISVQQILNRRLRTR